jgi:7-cyano-7-deazaguanine synthase
MDSCVTTALAARDTDFYALHFSYGQRTEARELSAARGIALALGAQDLLHLRIDLFRKIGGSALTDVSIAVPDASPAFREQGGPKPGEIKSGEVKSGEIKPGEVKPGATGSNEHAIPVTYVPFRNAHFLSAAVSWAEVLGAARIYIGAVEQDSSGYPDCRPAYYQAFQQVIATGTREGAIQIETPLIALSKAEIVRLGLECNAPLDLTWSCYRDEQAACGACESCVLRLKAFAAAGVPDPIPYAAAADRRLKATDNQHV